MRKLLKRFLDWLVAWGQRKIDEDTISEEETVTERILRDIEKMMEDNKVK